MKEIQQLLQTIARLRDPQDGCPWDLKQTHQSLTPYLLEEAYEAVEAIQVGDPAAIKDELGDVLLQVVLHAQIANEAGEFEFADVAASINDKMIRRHPHVFSDRKFSSQAEQKRFWEAEKQREKGALTAPASALDNVPVNLPALLKAEKIQKKAAQVGFDWDETAQVVEKVEEELAEMKAALINQDAVNLEEELGDLLFAIVNLTRFVELNAESTLAKANQKFSRRFRAVEALARADQKSLNECELDQLERYWDRVKILEHE